MYRKIIKPMFDRLLALILMVLLAPILSLVALLIYVFDGRPVLFNQFRSGFQMRKFQLLKFRSLVPSDNPDLSVTHRQFTRTGRILRKTGIDELPQLWNILKGEMSFVGPRPMPVEYDEKYSEKHRKRFQVMPGITGWAQVVGRNRMSWQERFALDVWYTGHQSLLLDIKIALLTIRQLLKLQPETPMPVFNGSN